MRIKDSTSQAQRLREQAAKARELAALPSRRGNGALLAAAERLDRKAAELEAAERLFEPPAARRIVPP